MAQNSLPPSVATAALLKSQLDQGRDYFDLLTPFVRRGVQSLSSDVVEPLELRKRIATELGLDVPLRTLSVLLDRLSKRQESGIKKEGSAFLRAPASSAVDLSPDLDADFAYLGDSFALFCVDRLPNVHDSAGALETLCGFLETHATTLVLDQPFPRATTGRREDIVVASFLQTRVSDDARASSACTALIQGLVLARAVTLKDLSEIERRPSDLVVYLDTPFILAIAGLYSEADLEATREAVRLVKDAGATPAVFDVTIAEVRRVLAVYESRLDTADGRQGLYRTPLTTFFLARNATGADVRTHSALVQATVEHEGVVVHATPARERQFVEDEAGLVGALQDVRGEGYEARETHDINCVAAILTLRRGRVVSSLENARAVLAATGMVVRTTREWWQKTGGKGMPPVMEQSAVVNYFWLKRPRVYSNVHRLELAALCTSILQPSPHAWLLFRQELGKMTQDGRLSTSEASLILIDSYASKLMVESEESETLDPGSVAEIVSRVRHEQLRETEIARAETAHERDERRREAEAAEDRRQRDLSAIGKSYGDQLATLSSQLETERTRASGLESAVAGIARILAWICTVPIVGFAVAAVLAVTLFPAIGGTGLPKMVQAALQALTVLVGFGGGIFGWSALSVGKPLQRRIERRLLSWLLPDGGDAVAAFLLPRAGQNALDRPLSNRDDGRQSKPG